MGSDIPFSECLYYHSDEIEGFFKPWVDQIIDSIQDQIRNHPVKVVVTHIPTLLKLLIWLLCSTYYWLEALASLRICEGGFGKHQVFAIFNLPSLISLGAYLSTCLNDSHTLNYLSLLQCEGGIRRVCVMDYQEKCCCSSDQICIRR